MISESTSKVKGSLSDLFWKYYQNSPFNLPQFFFARRVVEMIAFPQSIVSLVEAMYQSAFLSLEFRLNSELVSYVAKHKFKKFVKNSGSTLFQIFHWQ